MGRTRTKRIDNNSTGEIVGRAFLIDTIRSLNGSVKIAYGDDDVQQESFFWPIEDVRVVKGYDGTITYVDVLSDETMRNMVESVNTQEDLEIYHGYEKINFYLQLCQ